jgi:hypothetical protein
MSLARVAFAAALLACGSPGCGPGRPPSRSLDEAAARRALADALESWKAGRPHADPSATDPTLTVADEDWLGGARLLDYRLLPGEQAIGPRLSFPVAIVLDGPGGRRIRKQVTYAVGTDPSPSVIRQD